MAMFFYPLKKLVEISIWDPRLSARACLSKQSHDYSRDVPQFQQMCCLRTKNNWPLIHPILRAIRLL